jgi:hypothetical protein
MLKRSQRTLSGSRWYQREIISVVLIVAYVSCVSQFMYGCVHDAVSGDYGGSVTGVNI